MKVIVNADDFGSTSAVNHAVIRSHREGILTSTSLMVSGEAVEEAVTMARQTPTLAVGLHVVVTQGHSVLPRNEIPHLVDDRGYFSSDLLRLGFRYALGPEVREELSQELAAQFAKFASFGLPLSHVDSHLHMHMHPSVFSLLLPLIDRYGASGIRLPRDDLGLSLRFERRQAGTKILWAIVFYWLCRWSLSQLHGHHLVIPQQVYGLMQTGNMQQDYVIKVLQQLNVPTAELFFHPSLEETRQKLGPNQGDLSTLLSPSVRRQIHEEGLELSTYPQIYTETQSAFAPS